MDVHAVLKALHQERELLNQAIVTLEILARDRLVLLRRGSDRSRETEDSGS